MTAPNDFICKACGQRTVELEFYRIGVEIAECAKLDVPLSQSLWERICCDEERAALRKQYNHTAEIPPQKDSPRKPAS